MKFNNLKRQLPLLASFLVVLVPLSNFAEDSPLKRGRTKPIVGVSCTRNVRDFVDQMDQAILGAEAKTTPLEPALKFIDETDFHGNYSGMTSEEIDQRFTDGCEKVLFSFLVNDEITRVLRDPRQSNPFPLFSRVWTRISEVENEPTWLGQKWDQLKTQVREKQKLFEDWSRESGSRIGLNSTPEAHETKGPPTLKAETEGLSSSKTLKISLANRVQSRFFICLLMGKSKEMMTQFSFEIDTLAQFACLDPRRSHSQLEQRSAGALNSGLVDGSSENSNEDVPESLNSENPEFIDPTEQLPAPELNTIPFERGREGFRPDEMNLKSIEVGLRKRNSNLSTKSKAL